MEAGLRSFGWLDWFLLAILLFSVIRAMMRGMVRELFWLVGTILGLTLACAFYAVPAPALQAVTHSYPVAEALSFLLIILAVMVLAGLMGLVLSRMLRFVGLGWADSLAGALFGLIRGVLLITAFMMAAAAFLPLNTAPGNQISKSVLAPYFLRAAHAVSSVVPADLQRRITAGTYFFHQ